jgi:hypothetical protein
MQWARNKNFLWVKKLVDKRCRSLIIYQNHAFPHEKIFATNTDLASITVPPLGEYLMFFTHWNNHFAISVTINFDVEVLLKSLSFVSGPLNNVVRVGMQESLKSGRNLPWQNYCHLKHVSCSWACLSTLGPILMGM